MAMPVHSELKGLYNPEKLLTSTELEFPLGWRGLHHNGPKGPGMCET